MTIMATDTDLDRVVLDDLDFAPGCALRRKFGFDGHMPCPNEAVWIVTVRKPCQHLGVIPLCDPCYQRAFINAGIIYMWRCMDPTGSDGVCQTMYTPRECVIDVRKV